MTNLPAEQQEQEVAPFDYDLIRRMYAKDCTTDEFRIFCQLAQTLGLNPALHHIWAVKYPGGGPATFIVGRDGLHDVAHRDPAYDGMEAGSRIDEKGDLIGWCRVFRKDMSHPFFVEVYYDEYAHRKSNGEVTKFWKEKPRTMIQKVAEAQALRKAFRISGVYCEDEMPSASEPRVIPDTSSPVQEDPKGNPNKCAKCGGDVDPEKIENLLTYTDGVPLCNACFKAFWDLKQKAQAAGAPAPVKETLQEPAPKQEAKPAAPEKTFCQCGKEIAPGTTHCQACVEQDYGEIPPKEEPAPDPEPKAAPEAAGPVCKHCGKALTEKEVMVCKKLLGGALCCAGCLTKIQRGEIEA